MADGEYRPFRLSGGRFEEAAEQDAGFPLEAIDELRRYERLLVEVARGLWKRENPDRERAPRRFSESLRLRLIAIEDGSVAPVLAPLAQADARLFDDGLVETSTEMITHALSAVARGEALPSEFPESATSTLVQLGSGLHENESYILSLNGNEEISYTQSARRHLLKVTSGETISVDGELIGRINEINADQSTFEFLERSGTGPVRGSFDRSELFDEIKDLTKPARDTIVVRLSGRYATDRAGHLSSIENVDDVDSFVSPGDPMGPRLLELLGLGFDWDDAGATPPSTDAVERARDFVAQIAEELQNELRISPTVDGGIFVERQVEARRWTLEIEAGGDRYIVKVDPDHGRPTVSQAESEEATVKSFREFFLD